MVAVPAGTRDDLNDVEDVALLVALAETFSFEPVRLSEIAPPARPGRLSSTFERGRALGCSAARGVLRLLAMVRSHVRVPRPHVRVSRVRRVRRYAVQPIVLEGPRRVPIEVLDLSHTAQARARASRT